MKYISTICISMLLLSSYAHAQSMASDSTAPAPKKHSFKSLHGHEVLPQKGDWALGISATGFLNYIGNVMNGSNSVNAPAFTSANEPVPFAIGSLGGVAVMAKYMRSADFAYRIRFQANAGNFTMKNDVLKDLITPDPLNPVFVEDKEVTISHIVLVSAGVEKRRGHGRLQGFYGAEVLAGMSGTRNTFTYGNGFTSDFNSPLATTNFGSGSSANQSVRIRESYNGERVLLGVRGYTGVEYFFAPKMSLGGEIGYTLGFSMNTKGYNTTEQWYPGTGITATATTKTDPNAGRTSWGIGLDNINAGINLHFYF